MSGEFRNALPDHVKPERFERVVLTVVQLQPELLMADRRTLLAECVKCATDGLVPDGREAALVTFKQKGILTVKYMPMIGGILKRLRNSGVVDGIIVNVVHDKDEFEHDPTNFDHPVRHKPPALGTDRGNPIGAYALVKLKDGTIMHDVMGLEEINKVRAVSRASSESSPWNTWWDQMARKTVFRRLSKYLPLDAEIMDFVRRDDDMTDLGESSNVHAEQPAQRTGATAALKQRMATRAAVVDVEEPPPSAPPEEPLLIESETSETLPPEPDKASNGERFLTNLQIELDAAHTFNAIDKLGLREDVAAATGQLRERVLAAFNAARKRVASENAAAAPIENDPQNAPIDALAALKQQIDKAQFERLRDRASSAEWKAELRALPSDADRASAERYAEGRLQTLRAGA